jgi:hypothetical protein
MAQAPCMSLIREYLATRRLKTDHFMPCVRQHYRTSRIKTVHRSAHSDESCVRTFDVDNMDYLSDTMRRQDLASISVDDSQVGSLTIGVLEVSRHYIITRTYTLEQRN